MNESSKCASESSKHVTEYTSASMRDAGTHKCTCNIQMSTDEPGNERCRCCNWCDVINDKREEREERGERREGEGSGSAKFNIALISCYKEKIFTMFSLIKNKYLYISK